MLLAASSAATVQLCARSLRIPPCCLKYICGTVLMKHKKRSPKCTPLCLAIPSLRCVRQRDGKQAPCLSHLDLNAALMLHSCKSPAALPGYPNTMCSIARPRTKLGLCPSFFLPRLPLRRLGRRRKPALTDASEMQEEKENVN